MKKVIFITVLLVVFNLGIARAQNKPNFIFFIVDDLGWGDLSISGSQFYETPNIDRLAENGVRFDNSYTAHPRCVPARFAMFTGKFPAREGVPGRGNMELSEVTIAEALKEHGYSTFYTGKWHLGHDESHWPQNQGFDVNKGGCDAGAPPSYFYPYNKTNRKSGENIGIKGLEEGIEGEYITDRLTDEAIKYIKQHKDGPFFATVAHYAVHTPLEAKKEKIAKYEKKLKSMTFEGEEFTFGADGRQKMHQNNAIYAAMIESVDESLGRLIQTLKEEGIYDNTIILLISDHGGLSNSGPNNTRDLATSNLPYRAGKGHLYEGGIKIPTIVHWKGVADDGSVKHSLITGADYYPTFLEMAGLPLKPEQHVDGVSFVSALKGEEINQDRAFFWHSPLGRPAQTGDHNSSTIRLKDYKLIHFYDENRVELYNIKNDPYEKNNIAEQEPVMTKMLLQKLNSWKKDINAFDKKANKKKNK